MPLPLIPLLGAAAGTVGRVALTGAVRAGVGAARAGAAAARAGAGAARAGAGIVGRLGTSFGGAFLRRGAVGAAAGAVSAGSGGSRGANEQEEYDDEEDAGASSTVSAEEIETTTTTNASVGPSTDGDIGGVLRGSPLSVLKEIEQNTKNTAQAIAGMKKDREIKSPDNSFLAQNRKDVRGGGASLLLALVPLVASAMEPLREWFNGFFSQVSEFANTVGERFSNAIEYITTGVQGLVQSIRDVFDGMISAFNGIVSAIDNIINFISSLIPSAADPSAQPGGENAEQTRQDFLQTQVRATNEFNRLMNGTAIPSNVRDEIQEQFLSGRVTTTAQARNLVGAYISPNTPDFDAAMQAFESINQQRQRDAAYGAGEAGTLEFPEAAPQPRTADSRISPISREDRSAIDETARAMGINPTTITGGIFAPSGELDALIERGGGRREVPAEIRNRSRQAATTAQTAASNAAAQPDEFSSADAINQISTGITADDAALNRALDRLRPVQPQSQQPVSVPTPVMIPTPQQGSTGTVPSSAAPAPGTGVPAGPPPAHPGLVNEPASPAASR